MLMDNAIMMQVGSTSTPTLKKNSSWNQCIGGGGATATGIEDCHCCYLCAWCRRLGIYLLPTSTLYSFTLTFSPTSDPPPPVVVSY